MKQIKIRPIWYLLLFIFILAPHSLSAKGKKPPATPKNEKTVPMKSKYFDPNSIVTVDGVVEDIYTIKQKDGSVSTLCLLFRDGAVVYSVHLGPQWYVDGQKIDIKRGISLTVVASRVTVDDILTLIALEVRGEGNSLKLRDKNGVSSWFDPDKLQSSYEYCQLDSGKKT